MPEMLIIDVADVDEAEVALQGVYDGVVDQFMGLDYMPLLQRIEEDLQKMHAGYFAAETGPTGEKWKPLAKSTVERKGHDIILIEKGNLRMSLVNRGHQDAVRYYVENSPWWGLSFGTSVPYSIYHQLGTSNDRPPQREHIGVSTKGLEDVTIETADYMFDEMIA